MSEQRPVISPKGYLWYKCEVEASSIFLGCSHREKAGITGLEADSENDLKRNEKIVAIFLVKEHDFAYVFCTVLLSPSARRAWIEIVSGRKMGRRPVVALRTEGVD